jgi:ABC-type bacteriocin/lantibiotic exporter with double-glycine peptidase domain
VLPYVSQSGTLNGCGEACLAMIGQAMGKSTTVKDVERAMGRYGLMDTLSHLKAGADRLGIPLKQFSYIGTGYLEEYTNNGQPAICLVDYKLIPPYAKRPGETYTGGHYVLVYRIDRYVWYHDPLFRASVQISRIEFLKAFKNMALVSLNRFESNTEEETEMDENTFLKHWVPFVRDQRRRQSKLLGAYVKKTGKGDAIGMYDSQDRLIKTYTSATEYEDDGWKTWSDVGKKDWLL